MPFDHTATSVDIWRYTHNQMHRTGDGRSEDMPDNTRAYDCGRHYVQDFERGMMARIHGKDDKRLIHLGVWMIAAIALCFMATALTGETVSALLASCGAC